MTTKKPATKKFDIVRTVNLDSEEVVTGEVVSREAPADRDFNKSMVIMPVMNDQQLSILLNRTPGWAIKTRQGKAGQIYKYVPHGYVTDSLNKAFGFDWDLVIDPMFEGRMYAIELEEIYNTKTKQTTQRRHMAITGHLTIRVHNPNSKEHEVIATIQKSGFDSQEWLPTMEFGDALKGARSDLIKTCAYQLGIALDLYWNERAEISEFENQVREREEKAVKEKWVQDQAKSGSPTNFASLLSKAQTDFQFDGNELERILDLTMDDIMEFTPEQIVEAWNKIAAAGSKK